MRPWPSSTSRLCIFLARTTPWPTVSVGGPIPPAWGMTDVSAHGDEADTAEAKRIIEMERLMEEEGVKCFVVIAADAPLRRRMGRAVRVLAPERAESDKHLFPESCLQDDWTDN